MDLSADPWAGRDPRGTTVDQAAMAKRYGPNWQAGVSGPHSNVWEGKLQELFAARTAPWSVIYEQWDGIPIRREIDDSRYSLDPRIFPPAPPVTTVTVTAPGPGGVFEPGQQLTVEWATSGPVSSHTLSLSIDGGPFNNLKDLPKAARSFTFALPSVSAQSQGLVKVTAKDSSGTPVAQENSQPFTIKPKVSTEPPKPEPIKVPDDVKETLRILTAARGPFVIGPGRAGRIKRLADWVLGLEKPPV
jgi:hypothetical protein